MPGRRDRSRKLHHFAREMRSQPTDAERKLWSILRQHQVEGFRFRRQFPVSGYILDFFCIQANLAIEADGGHHGDPQKLAYDKERDAFLAQRGIRILRFSNDDILKNLDAVAETILRDLNSTRPPPLPSPGIPEEGEGEASHSGFPSSGNRGEGEGAAPRSGIHSSGTPGEG